MICYEVVIQANIVKWVWANNPKRAGEHGMNLVQNENWIRPGTVSVVRVIESDASEEFLSHHAVSIE